jgi:hypothetical protein
MLATYIPRPVPVTAAQWDGTNLDDFTELAQGAAQVAPGEGGTLSVTVPGRTFAPLLHGWWLSRDPRGEVTVQSDRAFRGLYEAGQP